MISTACLMLLLAFEILYLTSKQYKQASSLVFVKTIVAKPRQFRLAAAILFSIGSALIISGMGWVSGSVAVVVAVMATGSLVVVLQPFRYIGVIGLSALYAAVLLLEIFI
ncbi:hypothetical protein [Pedobacter soli]|uniref:Uncharacterized protein n=1 Tax=Pedobacter soli TaxID=390242 RepID=A0A1G6JWU5_9SPHI|nr:hypothetical protein [Pedobacter soli]SDC23184.1 hypothetical protein SAMN04488024_101581 [Pedobacter soli]